MPRERDLLFDSLIEHLRINADYLTRSERGRINKALKELREVGATPDDIRSRVIAWRARWPRIHVTATGLAANWAQLAPMTVRTINDDTLLKILDNLWADTLKGIPRQADVKRLWRERLTPHQKANPTIKERIGRFA